MASAKLIFQDSGIGALVGVVQRTLSNRVWTAQLYIPYPLTRYLLSDSRLSITHALGTHAQNRTTQRLAIRAVSSSPP